MPYIDGYVLPVPRKNLKAYARMARAAGKIWMKHGALQFRECAGDDLNINMCLPFPKQLKTRPGETVLFSYVVFKSRAHRDRTNAKVMQDPALKMDMKNLPFDAKRMLYGGFKTLVDL